jgi:hypothetical protein
MDPRIDSLYTGPQHVCKCDRPLTQTDTTLLAAGPETRCLKCGRPPAPREIGVPIRQRRNVDPNQARKEARRRHYELKRADPKWRAKEAERKRKYRLRNPDPPYAYRKANV